MERMSVRGSRKVSESCDEIPSPPLREASPQAMEPAL